MLPLQEHIRTRTYSQLLLDTFGSSIVAYWPLWETAGTTAVDFGGNGRNAVYTSVTPGTGVGLNSKPCLSVPGTAGYVSVSSQAANLNRDEGAFGCFVSGVDWDTATARRLWCAKIDGSNYFELYKPSANLTEVAYYGSAVYAYTNAFITNTGWVHLVMTWSRSNNRIRLYVNGVQPGSDATPLGAIVGSFGTYVRIGLDPATSYWKGLIADCVLLNAEPTPAQVLAWSKTTVFPTKTLSVIGDSISAQTINLVYHLRVVGHTTTSMMRIRNHAVGGESIIGNMATEVAAAAADDADIIIVELGTNDNDAGDMNALQTTYQNNIATLKISNPRAKIYGLNVLPKWTNNTTGPEVAKGNIRTAVAAACANRGVTCWDTYTNPWITQAQTTDGTHPTAAGHDAIATQVLALLP